MARVATVIALTMIVALVGCLLMSSGWTNSAQPPPPAAPKAVEKYAVNWEIKAEPVAFDAKRAMGYLQDVCKIGPRMSGTASMKKQQELMEKHFKAFDCKLTWQKFSARQRSQRQATEMANLIVSFNPEQKRRIILCTHYDTRPIADQDPEPKNRRKPIVSANDGGSGVALLMEMAQHMKDLPLNVGVDFVFFDGEEYIFQPRNDEYFFGSKYFADDYRRTRKDTGVTYLGAILLDMIAGRDLRLPVEQNSWWSAPALVKDVYRIAEAVERRRLSREIK